MAQYELSKDELLRVIRYDCEMFLAFYLGEELSLEVPEFHVELWDEFLTLLDRVNEPGKLTGVLKKLLGVPREHAKTTLVKLACVLFFRYSRLSFLAYVSNTFGAALNAVKDIKDWFMSPQDRELYGAIEPRHMIEKSSDTAGEVIMLIMTPFDSRPKTIIMKAFGVSTQIRGTVIKNKRPDFLVFDDCESLETAGNATSQAKLDAWCLGTAIKSMAKMGVCIFIGNMISDTTLLARMSREPEWNATVFGSIIRNQVGDLVPLWPGRHTLQSLLEEYASYRRLGNGHVWEAEMMNLTNKEILGENMAGAIRPPLPMPEQLECGFICLDPAFGEKAIHDQSAITVHARIYGLDIPVVIAKWTGRVREEGLLDEMLNMSYRWGLNTWCIESNAAQKLLIPLFRSLLVNRRLSPETFVMVPVTADNKSKVSRIVAFRKIVADGSYAICETEGDLIQLLEDYVPGLAHDDLEDCAAYGNAVWSLHGGLIKGQGRVDIMGQLFGTNSLFSATTSLDMGV